MPGRSAVAVIVACALALAATDARPVATRTRERRVDNDYRQGLARYGDGWIFAGTNGLWRTDDDLRVEASNAAPIPEDLRARGYNHLGDVDVAGAYLYAPLEQPDHERNEQVMVRYDARTLDFVDAVTVRQHENSFVAIDVRAGTAYSMDRFGGDRVLRYDLGGLRWRPKPPLRLSRPLENVQGADLGDGFVYLSTSDENNTLYRVELGTGTVTELGSAGHAGGEGEGIDFTKLASGRIHTLTIGNDKVSVFLADFEVPAPRRTGRAEQWILGITVATTLVATVAIVALTRRRWRKRADH
jgi:hypothetical protein